MSVLIPITALSMMAWAADPDDAPLDGTAIRSWGKEDAGRRRDPFADKALRRALRRVVPAVEAAAGRPFLREPVVALASDEAFTKVLREEAALVQSAVNRDTAPELRARIVADAAQGVPRGVLGKYAVFEDTLFLCPDNLREAAHEIGAESLAAVVTVVLVHELGHALHDQYADLAALMGALPDQDALWALEGTSEGLANFLELRAAEALGLPDLSGALNRLQGWTDEGPLVPEAFRIWSLYGQGADMMAWHYAHGGVDRLWKVALQPPTQTKALFRPETWPAERTPPSLDFAAILRGTEQNLTRADWLVAISRLGEATLRAEAFSGGDPDGLDPVLAGIDEAWQLHALRPDRQAEIRIVTFAGAEDAQRYLTLAEGHDVSAATRLGARLDREVEVVTEPFDAVPGDAAARRTSVVVGLGGTRLERRSAWVVRGNTLVVASTEDYRPGKRLGWTIESVFARLEAARRGDVELPPAAPERARRRP